MFVRIAGYIQKWNDLFHRTDMICILLTKILKFTCNSIRSGNIKSTNLTVGWFLFSLKTNYYKDILVRWKLYRKLNSLILISVKSHRTFLDYHQKYGKHLLLLAVFILPFI